MIKLFDTYKEMFKKRLLNAITSIEVINAMLKRSIDEEDTFLLTKEELIDMVKVLDKLNSFVEWHRWNMWKEVPKDTKKKKK